MDSEAFVISTMESLMHREVHCRRRFFRISWNLSEVSNRLLLLLLLHKPNCKENISTAPFTMQTLFDRRNIHVVSVSLYCFRIGELFSKTTHGFLESDGFISFFLFFFFSLENGNIYDCCHFSDWKRLSMTMYPFESKV